MSFFVVIIIIILLLVLAVKGNDMYQKAKRADAIANATTRADANKRKVDEHIAALKAKDEATMKIKEFNKTNTPKKRTKEKDTITEFLNSK